MKKLDYFRYYPVITVNNEEGLSTTLGGILTIVMIILTISSIVLFGENFYLKKNPQVVTSTENNSSPFLSKNDFFLAFGFAGVGNKVIPDLDRYIEVQYGYLAFNYDNQTIFYYENAVNCSTYDEKFKHNYNKLDNYINFDPSYYYCGNEKMKSDIINSYGSVKFQNVDIRVTTCKNTTLNSNCKSNEEIHSVLNMFFVGLVYSDNLVNPRDLNHPITPSYRNGMFRISTSSSRQIIIYYSNLIFESDEGWLLNDEKTITSFTYDSMESDIITTETQFFLRLIFTIKSSQTKINRSYTKIFKVAADVGGVSRTIMIVLYIINYIFAKVSFLRYVKSYLMNLDHLKNLKCYNCIDILKSNGHSRNNINKFLQFHKNNITKDNKENLFSTNKANSSHITIKESHLEKRNHNTINNYKDNSNIDSSNVNFHNQINQSWNLNHNKEDTSNFLILSNNRVSENYSKLNKIQSNNNANYANKAGNYTFLDLNYIKNNKGLDKNSNSKHLTLNNDNFNNEIVSKSNKDINPSNNNLTIIDNNNNLNPYEIRSHRDVNVKSSQLNLNEDNLNRDNNNDSHLNSMSDDNNAQILVNINNLSELPKMSHAFSTPVYNLDKVQNQDRLINNIDNIDNTLYNNPNYNNKMNNYNKFGDRRTKFDIINTIYKDYNLNPIYNNKSKKESNIKDNKDSIENKEIKEDCFPTIINNKNTENLEKQISNNNNTHKSNDKINSFKVLNDLIEETTSSFKELLESNKLLLLDTIDFYLCKKSKQSILLNSIYHEFNKKYSIEDIINNIEEHQLLKESSIRNKNEFNYWLKQNVLYRFATGTNIYDANSEFKDYIAQL